MKKIVESTSIFDDKNTLVESSKSVRFLNAEDKIVKIEHYIDDSAPNSIVEIEYANGFVIKEIETTANGDTFSRNITRDVNGKKIEETIISHDGRKLYEFTLDTSQNEAKEIEFNEDGDPISQKVTIYNEQGLVVREIEDFGIINSYYNEEGLLIRREIIENDTIVAKESFDYSNGLEVRYSGMDLEIGDNIIVDKDYNESGQVLSETRSIDEDVIARKIYTYSEDQLVKVETTSELNTILTTYEYV